MRESGAKNLFLLILMTLLFGLSFIASKNALQGLGIFQLIFLRYVFALALLTIIFRNQLSRFKIDRKHFNQFLTLTLVEPVGYFIFETAGVKYTSPAGVSLMIATIPVFSLIIAWWLLKEKNNRWGIVGILFSIAGVYLIVSIQKQTGLAPRPVLGSLFSLLAAAAAGFYNVLCRRLSQSYSPLTITYYQTVVATAVFLPLAGLETLQRPESHLNGWVLLNVLYLALGCSVLAYLILNHMLSKIQTARVAIFANLVPVVTIFATWLLYGELLEPAQWLGTVLVMSGIYLTFSRRTPGTAAGPIS